MINHKKSGSSAESESQKYLTISSGRGRNLQSAFWYLQKVAGKSGCCQKYNNQSSSLGSVVTDKIIKDKHSLLICDYSTKIKQQVLQTESIHFQYPGGLQSM